MLNSYRLRKSGVFFQELNYAVGQLDRQTITTTEMKKIFHDKLLHFSITSEIQNPTIAFFAAVNHNFSDSKQILKTQTK